MRALTFIPVLTLAVLLAPAPRGAAAANLDAQWLAADRMACELAAQTRDVPMLERCTANLYAAAPRDAKTIEMQWALALARGQGREARALVARARALALPPDSVARMEHATEALLPEPRTVASILFIVGCALGLSAAVLGMIISVRRHGVRGFAQRWWPTALTRRRPSDLHT